jgi:hypothetical protein
MARVWVDQSAPRTLVDLQLSGSTGYFASAPVNVFAQPYLGRLIDEPVVRRRIVDVFWGPIEIQDAEFTVANLDGRFTADYVADLRGNTCTIQRFDATYAVTSAEWVGKVEQASLTGDGRLEIRGTNVDLAIFDEKIPWPTVETSAFPLALDVGMTIPVVFGNVPKVQLPYVCHDRSTPKFHYALWGPVTFAQLWRNGPNDSVAAIQTSEYTVSNAVYSGLTTVQFLVEQVDFSGAPHTIYADVVGFATERDFVRAVQRMLTDTLWGLEQTVDTANFNAAAGSLSSATGGLLCDAALTESSEAKNYLRQALMVRGMRLAVNGLGQWQIFIDTAPGAPVLALGDGPGPGPRNVLRVGRRTRIPASDRPASFGLRYRYDLMAQGFLFTAERTLDSKGRSYEEENAFIRDHATADKVADYLGKRQFYGQQTVEDVQITPVARTLSEGQLVTFTYPPLGYANATLEVRELHKDLETITATLAEYSASIHTYTPGPLPADNISGTFSDLTRTPPAAASALSIVGSGTEIGSDGGTGAWLLLQYTTPSINCTGARIDLRKNGETVYQQGYALASGVGANQQTRIRGLVPGVAYDLHVVTFNGLGLVSTTGATVLNQLAPGDTGAPSTPTGVNLYSSQNRTLVIAFNPPPTTDRDIKGYEFQVHAAPNGGGGFVMFGTMPIGALGAGGAFPAETISYANLGDITTYYVRLRAFDYSNNVSPWTTGADNPAFSFARPDPPSGFGVVGSGIDQGNDGGTSAFVVLQYYLPTANCVGSRVDFKRAGPLGDSWHQGVVVTHRLATDDVYTQVRVRGLVPNLGYDYQVVSLSGLGLASTASILTSVVAVKDTVNPATPTGLVATPAVNKTVHLTFNPNPDADIKGYDWDIAGLAYGSVAVSAYQASISISLEAFQYNVTYSVTIWAFDFSGNYSSSASAPATFIFATPPAPSVILAQAAGLTSDAAGNWTAWFQIYFQAVAGTIRLDYKKSTDSVYHSGAVNVDFAGGEGSIKIDGLIPGVLYNYRLVVINALNIASPPALLDYTAPADTVAPAVPYSFYFYQSGDTFQVLCKAFGNDLDYVEYEIRNMSNATMVEGKLVASKNEGGTWNSAAIAFRGLLGYGTQYKIRGRAVDYSNNRSAWTSGADEPTFTLTTTGTTDITANAIHQWVWGGNSSPGSIPADGVFYPAIAVTINNVLPSSVVLIGATVYVTNNDAALPARTFGFQLRNLTTGQLFPPTYSTVPNTHSLPFTMTLFDFPASAGGTYQYCFQLSSIHTGAQIAFQHGFIQVAEMRR